MEIKEKQRLHLLDSLRGTALINMIVFHGLWDLVFLFGVPIPWYTELPGYIWQQSICWTFILLSGFCWQMGSRPVKRGLEIFGGGLLVSLVTHIFTPDSSITFGILTFTGSAVLLTAVLHPLLRRISNEVGAGVSFGLFLLLRNCEKGTLGFEKLVITPLPVSLYRNLLTTYLGFPYVGFSSADYFPLLPWLFLFLTGYFLYGILLSRRWEERLFSRGEIPVLSFMGMHSLIIYLLHQPVLYGLSAALNWLIK